MMNNLQKYTLSVALFIGFLNSAVHAQNREIVWPQNDYSGRPGPSSDSMGTTQRRTSGLFIQTEYGGNYFQTWPEFDKCQEDDWLCLPFTNVIMEKVGITIGRWDERKMRGIEIVYYYNPNKIDKNNIADLRLSEIWQLSYITSKNWIETSILKSPVEFALNSHFAAGFYYYRGIEPNSESSDPPTKKVRWYTVGIDIGLELQLGFRSGSSKIMAYFEPINISFTTRTLGMGIKGGLAINF